jgi:hypothetical protein
MIDTIKLPEKTDSTYSMWMSGKKEGINGNIS